MANRQLIYGRLGEQIEKQSEPFPAERMLSDRLKVVEDEARDILSRWFVAAPHFTDHGPLHAEGVIRGLDKLIPPSMYPKAGRPGALRPYEIFLLLAAAWLHDIGMVKALDWLEHHHGKPKECQDNTCPLESANSQGKETENRIIRRCHHCLSSWAIREFVGRQAQLDRYEAVLVGKLAQAHRHIVNLCGIEAEYQLRDVPVRGRFLAALLRLADGIDLGPWRIPRNPPPLARRDPEAQFHTRLHELVTGVDVDPEQHEIRLHVTASTVEDAAIARRYRVREVREHLARDVLANEGIYYNRVIAVTKYLSEQPESTPPRILIVEDDRSVLTVLEDLVKKMGGALRDAVIDATRSRAHAESLLAEHLYHAAVVDLHLGPADPEGSRTLEQAEGFFLLREAPHPNKGIPAVLVSKRSWEPPAFEAIFSESARLNADFLAKPGPKADWNEFSRDLNRKLEEALARNP